MTPDVNTIEERTIAVGDGHELYVQHWGNKAAKKKIIFLHGGPGSGCSDKHKSLFDAETDQVLFLDQRGCGNSTPRGSLVANNTDKQVDDISVIADAFGFSEFVLTGGSWGSCLALVYAIRHPKRVKTMVIRGIFTGREREVAFLDQGGFRAFFPDVWAGFVESAPNSHKDNPSSYHLPRILGDDQSAAKESAYAYSLLESGVIGLDDRVSLEPFEDFDPIPTKLECHYLANRLFIPEGYIMEHVSKLSMPVFMVQGRYDAVCPPFTAYELSQILPNGQLFWTTAGHSGNDRANWDQTRLLLQMI